nr:GGDEF domain-containing protein [Actinomycetota bacterium]
RVGHILAGYVSRARRWRPWERRFIGQLAAEATLVMESARLREIDQANRERLLHQATHDALTDLANRRAFGVWLTHALDTAAGAGQNLSLLLLDVDRFKSVNDTLGHPAGDRLLVEVARSLLDVVRGPDLAARLGGDEFAVLLAGADHRQAETVAARISEAVDAACRRAGVPPGVAISIGISVYPDDGADGEALLQAADAAMYQAKRSGTRHRR